MEAYVKKIKKILIPLGQWNVLIIINGNQEMKKIKPKQNILKAHQKNHITSLDLTFNSKIKYFSTSSHFVM